MNDLISRNEEIWKPMLNEEERLWKKKDIGLEKR